VAGLRWSDLDLEASRLTVAQTRVSVDYAVVTGTPKTEKAGAPSGSIRRPSQPYAPTAPARPRRGSLGGRSGLTRASCSCGRSARRSIPTAFRHQMFAARAKAADLPPIRVHNLRHSYATAAQLRGRRTAQGRLGPAGAPPSLAPVTCTPTSGKRSMPEPPRTSPASSSGVRRDVLRHAARPQAGVAVLREPPKAGPAVVGVRGRLRRVRGALWPRPVSGGPCRGYTNRNIRMGGDLTRRQWYRMFGYAGFVSDGASPPTKPLRVYGGASGGKDGACLDDRPQHRGVVRPPARP
jgi:hypothetical protein